MKILVTGATGFLGTHVVAAARAEGHEVVAFSRRLGGDVRDPAAVRRVAAGCDAVLHCAGQVSRRAEDAEALYQVHVEGTKNVLDACEAVGVKRFVLASTSGTVSVSEDPAHLGTEADAPPVGLLAGWPYYRAKLFAERAALARSGLRLEVVVVNPSLLLGPGDRAGSSTGDVRMFLEGTLPAVPGGGIAFVDVRDAAETMLRALHRGVSGERYLVSACNLLVRELVDRLSRLTGIKAPAVTLPRSRRAVRAGAEWAGRIASRLGLAAIDAQTAEMASCFWYVDATKAERVLGFRARDPNATLHDTVDDLRARGVVWPVDPGEKAASLEGW